MLKRLLTFLKRPFFFNVDSLRFNLVYSLLTVVLYNAVFFKHAAAGSL